MISEPTVRVRDSIESRTRTRTRWTVDQRREAAAGYLLILPLFAGVSVFFFYPIVRSVILSFTKTGIFSGATFAGLYQYDRLIHDAQFWMSVGNTLVYAAVSLLGIPIAIIFAALLNTRGLRLVGTYRVLFFLPVVTIPVAVGMVWSLLYNQDFGVIDQALSFFGIGSIGWLTAPNLVMISIALVGVWAGLGQNIVLILSGLQTVPADVLEASSLDGAGPVRRFMSVTLPLISPTVFLVSVLNVIASLQVFDLVFIMVGPTNPSFTSAQTIVYYFYEAGFVQHNTAYAAAIAVALLVFTMLVTAVQFRLQNRWVNYDR